MAAAHATFRLTAFVEGVVNEIFSKRMIKKRQMRWNRWAIQPFLDVRVAVPNKTLAGSFRRLFQISSQTMKIPTNSHALLRIPP